MPILAGWLTGEQVSHEILGQTLTTMGTMLGQHGGQPAQIVQPGMGLITFSDPAHTMQYNDEPPVLDWVPDRRTFVYRRPLSGAHVLYYIENWPAQGNLLFASEIKALLAVGAPRHIHFTALDALLRYGFIPAPWTAFKNISVVPAGSILRWQRAKTVVNHATDFHLDEPSSSDDAIDQLHDLLSKAVVDMLPPHEQLVALVDESSSSALAALLTARHTTTTFTIAAFSYKKRKNRTAVQVAEVCQRPFLAVTGVNQPEFWVATLAGLESPSVDTRPLALHQLLHTVANETGARVAISGLGANVLQGRFPTSAAEISRIFSHDALQQMKQEEPWEETLHARKLLRRAEQFRDENQRQYYLDLHLRLPDHIVSMTHQLAMQEGMAVRSPYLRSDVMNMMTCLPTVLSDGTRKSDLFSVLVSRSFPNLKDGQVDKPLDMPMTSLLHVKDSELLRQTLALEVLQATGIFDPRTVEDLLRQKEVSRELVLVFTTQLLCQLFGASL